ncbi:MAG: hypothetical protein QM724_00545 [Flavobacteriales bacterium]
MRHLLVLSAFLFHLLAQAQESIPPDPFHEVVPIDKGYWENRGQLTDPEGRSSMEAAFISEGVYPFVYPAEGGRVSFTASVQSADSLIPDTLMRWDMRLLGGRAQEAAPIGVAPRADYRNYYFPHCGEAGLTMVRRFERVVYEEVYPGIDLHLYPGAAGQKFAFVCRPGSDPSLIAMLFEGLADITIEHDGSLSFPILSQTIRLPRPMAYQFQGSKSGPAAGSVPI